MLKKRIFLKNLACESFKCCTATTFNVTCMFYNHIKACMKYAKIGKWTGNNTLGGNKEKDKN